MEAAKPRRHGLPPQHLARAIPYLDEAAIDAFFTPAAELTAAQKLALAFSDRLVDELLAADIVVLGVPMWNLSIPASLKAWIDLIVREGRTFAFTATVLRRSRRRAKRSSFFPRAAVPTPPDRAMRPSIFKSRICAPFSASSASLKSSSSMPSVKARDPEAAAEGLAQAERALAALAG